MHAAVFELQTCRLDRLLPWHYTGNWSALANSHAHGNPSKAALGNKLYYDTRLSVIRRNPEEAIAPASARETGSRSASAMASKSWGGARRRPLNAAWAAFSCGTAE